MNNYKTYTHKRKISASMKKYGHNKKSGHMKVRMWFKSIDYGLGIPLVLIFIILQLFFGGVCYVSNLADERKIIITELKKEIKELKNEKLN